MIISHYLIRNKIQSLAAKAPKRPHVFRTLKEINRIVVLYNMEDQAAVEPCLETLRMMRKQIFTSVYVANAQSVPASTEAFCIVREKELNWLGYPSDTLCQQFLSQPADILIDLTRPTDDAMRYLLLRHPSTFKVGPKRSDLDLYDFSILMTNIPANKSYLTHLFGQMIFYLQTIRSK